MSKKLFTNEEIKLLYKNEYAKNITTKGIIYISIKKIFISGVASIAVNLRSPILSYDIISNHNRK